MPPGRKLPAPAAFAISGALHAAAFLALVRVPAPGPPAPEVVAVEILEQAPLPRAPAPPPPPAPARPPAPRAPPVAPRAAPPPPRDAPPPPPNAPPPEEAPPAEKAPVRIGISLSSSASAGGVAAPAGNTLYGEMPRDAPDPGAIELYRSERYAPPTQLTVLPRPRPSCYETSPGDYPEEAQRLQLEGVVRLALTVDETGTIVEARILEDPGHGFGAAAVAALKRHGCTFAPARRGGEPVGTSFVFKYRFQLP